MTDDILPSAYYHIHCFEKIADFQQTAFLDRLYPVTRSNWRLRGLSPISVMDGKYMVPGGIELLVEEWKSTRRMWIDKRDRVYDENKEQSDAALLYKTGSVEHQVEEMPPSMSAAEHPSENDGHGDTKELDLFDIYLDPSEEGFNNPHGLSAMLYSFLFDTVSSSNYNSHAIDTDIHSTLQHKGWRSERCGESTEIRVR